MVFSSFYFLLYFMPLFFISYYLVESKFKNLCILLYSIGFYTFGCFDNLYCVLILIFSLIINYIIAIVISNTNRCVKSLFLFIGLILNFGTLFIFKYYDFFVDIIKSIANNENFTKLNLILPIGISFYTFQIVSYLIDVYYEKIDVEKNFINFSTYVIMFPQLIAGPILRFGNIMTQIKEDRHIKLNDFFLGLKIFIIGLSSKVIIANQLSLVDLDIRNYGLDSMSLVIAWSGAISYAMQLYFDFYGYSLMAIGLGKMMGFDIIENFKDPFLSKTVTEYWRRWHISLGTWFRDYLLYPILLSNPIKKIRKSLSNISNKSFSNFFVNLIATFVVWFSTGLWHGANYNFILWGLYFFIFLNIEQLFLERFLIKTKVISHIYMIIVITISFVIFSNENFDEMILYLKKMFDYKNILYIDMFNKTILFNIKSILLGILFVVKLPQYMYKKISTVKIVDFVIILCLLTISLFLIYKGYNDPFMYFRF